MNSGIPSVLGPLEGVTASAEPTLPRRNLLTIREAAAELRVSKTTVLRLLAGGITNMPALPSIRLGRRVLIRRESLVRFTAQAERVNSAS
jgi:excisionase family DNA binding protein